MGMIWPVFQKQAWYISSDVSNDGSLAGLLSLRYVGGIASAVGGQEPGLIHLCNPLTREAAAPCSTLHHYNNHSPPQSYFSLLNLGSWSCLINTLNSFPLALLTAQLFIWVLTYTAHLVGKKCLFSCAKPVPPLTTGHQSCSNISVALYVGWELWFSLLSPLTR
jgi:hypothetical protein